MDQNSDLEILNLQSSIDWACVELPINSW